MTSATTSEWRELRDYVRRNGLELSVIFLGILFVLCAEFKFIIDLRLNSIIFFLALPVLSILLIFRRNPIYFGFQPGDFKVWGFHLMVACPLIGILTYLNSKSALVPNHYGLGVGAFRFSSVAETAAVVFALEYIYRGYFIFGLKDSMQEGAIMVQLIAFVLIHGGRSEAQIAVSVLFGLYLGYLSYRGKSFWPAFILHFFASVIHPIQVGW